MTTPLSTAPLPVRSDDPSTSYAAALKATLRASKVRPVVLSLITEQGPLTHDELIAAYRSAVMCYPETPTSSESGIRTRVKELVAAGLVTEAPTKGRSQFGNASKRWVAVPPDDYIAPEALAEQLIAEAMTASSDDSVETEPAFDKGVAS